MYLLFLDSLGASNYLKSLVGVLLLLLLNANAKPGFELHLLMETQTLSPKCTPQVSK